MENKHIIFHLFSTLKRIYLSKLLNLQRDAGKIYRQKIPISYDRYRIFVVTPLCKNFHRKKLVLL